MTSLMAVVRIAYLCSPGLRHIIFWVTHALWRERKVLCIPLDNAQNCKPSDCFSYKHRLITCKIDEKTPPLWLWGVGVTERGESLITTR